mgnify:CR=1 FL=1
MRVAPRVMPPVLLRWPTMPEVCQDLLNQYEAEGDSFLDCIITGDEIWYHCFELESNGSL